MPEKTSTLIRDIDKTLWIKFRKLCLDKDISANQQLINLIVRFVRERGEL